MPILGGRGWECGNSMLNTVDVNGTVEASLGAAHTGIYSLRTRTTAAWGRWAVAGTPANPSVSVWLFPNDGTQWNGNNYMRIRFLLGTGEYVELRWNGATHTFDAYVNNGLVAAGTVEVSVNDWFHTQFYAVIDDAGSIGVKIDGHQSITYNGDTQPGAATGATYVYLYGGGDANSYWDDLVWGTGGYLGAWEVYDKLAASDSVVAWTPSAGAVNYAMEDEVPNSDADYNETAVTATVDKLGLAALSLTDRVVGAVIAWSRAADPDAYGSSIKVGIDSNGTESTATTALAAAYEYYWGDVEAVDPDDSAAWNQAKVDAVLHMKESVIP